MNLYTPRLHLRPVNIEDKDSIFKYRSDPETNKYLGLRPGTVNDVIDFIRKCSPEMNMPGTWFQFAVIEKESGSLIGDIGIHFLNTDPENRQAEIGYTLSRNYRGKGYATEALSKIIDYLFYQLDKHRIIASVDPDNHDSVKLLERLKFRKEAHHQKSILFHGEWADDVIYAILAAEWKKPELKTQPDHPEA